MAPPHITHGGFWKIHWMIGVTVSGSSVWSTVESSTSGWPGTRMVAVSCLPTEAAAT